MITSNFWSDRRVFVTGHTGFKGSWLALWLQQLGATVCGYSLSAPTNPSLFEQASIEKGMLSVVGDVRDEADITNAMVRFQPDIVFHLAAQSLVRTSYEDPVQTYATNIMGTVDMFEAARKCSSVRVIINVTSDKCYEDREWIWGYRETDALGGYDPYASSKACAEIITNAYSRSFFSRRTGESKTGVASVRAGNVIGGGDWAPNRFVPDLMRAWLAGRTLTVRNPSSVRPWQHVLEPLRGYLMLAEKLWVEPERYTGGWNFGPREVDAESVQGLLELFEKELGKSLKWEHHDDPEALHEAAMLRLDISKAQHELGWHPIFGLPAAVHTTTTWYRMAQTGTDMRALTLEQISTYSSSMRTTQPLFRSVTPSMHS